MGQGSIFNIDSKVNESGVQAMIDAGANLDAAIFTKGKVAWLG